MTSNFTTLNKMRKGFSLVELVLSILIIAVVLLALPKIFTTSSQSNKASIMQSAIADAQELLTLILRAPWGCPHNDTVNNIIYVPVFNFGSTHTFYQLNDNIPSDGRRHFHNWDPDHDAPCVSIGNFTISSRMLTRTSSSVASRAAANVSFTNFSGNTDNNMRRIEIELDVQDDNKDKSEPEKTKIRIYAFAANTGDTPTLLTRNW